MSVQDNEKPKRRRKRADRLVFERVTTGKKVPTVGQLAESLHFSIMYLEIENPHVMPYELLCDAYEMAGMLVEAEGFEPHDALLDNIVYHYLKRRQLEANKIIKDMKGKR